MRLRFPASPISVSPSQHEALPPHTHESPHTDESPILTAAVLLAVSLCALCCLSDFVCNSSVGATVVPRNITISEGAVGCEYTITVYTTIVCTPTSVVQPFCQFMGSVPIHSPSLHRCECVKVKLTSANVSVYPCCVCRYNFAPLSNYELTGYSTSTSTNFYTFKYEAMQDTHTYTYTYTHCLSTTLTHSLCVGLIQDVWHHH